MKTCSYKDHCMKFSNLLPTAVLCDVEKWQTVVNSISLENREELLDALYAELEQNMQLIGATAINDKLQEGVPHTIAQLLDAGIRFWVLTGDKQGFLWQTALVVYDFV